MVSSVFANGRSLRVASVLTVACAVGDEAVADTVGAGGAGRRQGRCWDAVRLRCPPWFRGRWGQCWPG
jgi:hypothetical protein